MSDDDTHQDSQFSTLTAAERRQKAREERDRSRRITRRKSIRRKLEAEDTEPQEGGSIGGGEIRAPRPSFVRPQEPRARGGAPNYKMHVTVALGMSLLIQFLAAGKSVSNWIAGK